VTIEIVYVNQLKEKQEIKELTLLLIPVGKAGTYYYPQKLSNNNYPIYNHYNTIFHTLNGTELYIMTNAPINKVVQTLIFCVEEKIDKDRIIEIICILANTYKNIIFDLSLWKGLISLPFYEMELPSNLEEKTILKQEHKEIDYLSINGTTELFETNLEIELDKIGFSGIIFLYDYTKYDFTTSELEQIFNDLS